MRKRRFALPAAFMFVAAAVLAFGMSAQGRVQTSAISCGDTITSSVTFTADKDCSGTNATSIVIGADGVTVNLNGHTLTGNPGDDCIDNGQGVNPGYNNVTITGGKLAGCDDGIYSQYADHMQVKNMVIKSPASEGVYLYYMGSSKIMSTTVGNPVNEGFDLEYGASNSVTGSTVTNTTGTPDQLYVDEETNDTFSSNTLTGTPGATSGYGVYQEYARNNVYTSNTVTGSNYGMYIYCDDEGPATLTNNSVSGAYDYGFYIEDCYDDDGYYGPIVPSSITGNTASNTANGYGFYDDYNPNATYAGNTATNNYDGGFYFDDEEPADKINNNVSTGAQNGDGFYFRYAEPSYSPTTFNGNTATGNSGYGFYSNDYVLPGSGNTANNNGSANCYYVAGC